MTVIYYHIRQNSLDLDMQGKVPAGLLGSQNSFDEALETVGLLQGSKVDFYGKLLAKYTYHTWSIWVKITRPTQTMHYFWGEVSQSYHRFELFDHPKKDPCFLLNLGATGFWGVSNVELHLSW